MNIMNIENFINIAAARAEFGETVYAYHRIPVVFRSGQRRGQERHLVLDKVPCTKEEYDANYAEGCRHELERFVKGAAEYRRDYSRYERTVSKPGWKEQLIELLKMQL